MTACNQRILFDGDCLSELVKYEAVLILGLRVLCLAHLDDSLANFVAVPYDKDITEHVYHLAKERPLHA